MAWGYIKDFENAHLLVAGEVGIDHYIWGDTRRISPEAPVPVVEVDSETFKLGLSGNVAQNLTSLGAKATLITVCGEDADAEKLSEMLSQAKMAETVYIADPTRPTLRKVRVIAQKQHVVRVDYERSHALDAKRVKQFTEAICDRLDTCDGVIVQDYGKGLWNADTMAFVKEAKRKGKPVFVDPSRVSSLGLYHGVTLLTPNMVEAEALCKVTGIQKQARVFPEKHLHELALKILEETQADHSIVTCGEWGMVSVSKSDKQLNRIPTFARQVYDVTGAGDTVISVLSLMSVLGRPLPECMQVANAAAGIVVGQIGTATVSPQDLQAELERLAQGGLIQ